MSSVQLEIPRLPKKQKGSFHTEIIQLVDTEIAQSLDLRYKDMSAVIMDKFKVLKENLDLMVEEIRDSLKNDLKEILGVKSTIPEMEISKNPSTRKEWQQIKDTTSIKTGLVEKREGENYVEDIENVTCKRSKVVKLSSKLDQAEEYNTNQDKELSPNESQNHKVVENVEEAIRSTDDTGSNCNLNIEVTGEDQEQGEGVLVKEMKEENISQKFKNKDKILKASKEDEGAILTLAPDFSSAALDVSKQWSNVFNILRENDFEPKILCQLKLALKCDGEIRTFSDMQALSKFISQKSSMKELLKGIFPENENRKKGGRRYGIQERLNKTRMASKHGVGGATSDGLGFLFIEEVKVAEPEEVKSLETDGEEASELEEEEQEALGLEEGEEASELEEEGEEASELEEGEEESSGLEEDVSEYSERQEGDSSEWELGLFLGWGEEEDLDDSDVEKIKIEEKKSSPGLKELACGYLASDSEKKKLVKYELTSEEINLLQETEENFRRSVINSFREIQEEIGNIKNYHSENKKSSVVETTFNFKSTLSGRINILKEKVNNLEERFEEFSRDTRQMAKQIIIKERIRDIEDRSRSSNIRLIGIPEKDNKENGAEEIVKEIIEENFAELKKELSLDIVSAYRVPSKIDEKRLTPRHILVKFGNFNDREKVISASREKKEITYRGVRIRLTADFSLGTLDARSQWGSIIRVLQAKGFEPRILYPAKLSFDFEGKTKVFFDIEEFRKFVSRIPSLKELLENIF